MDGAKALNQSVLHRMRPMTGKWYTLFSMPTRDLHDTKIWHTGILGMFEWKFKTLRNHIEDHWSTFKISGTSTTSTTQVLNTQWTSQWLDLSFYELLATWRIIPGPHWNPSLRPPRSTYEGIFRPILDTLQRNLGPRISTKDTHFISGGKEQGHI